MFRLSIITRQYKTNNNKTRKPLKKEIGDFGWRGKRGKVRLPWKHEADKLLLFLTEKMSVDSVLSIE